MARPRIPDMLRTPSGRISRSREGLLARGDLVHEDYVVYFAKAAGRIKIGFSGALNTRIGAVACLQGEVVRVVGTAHLPTSALARKLERKMHEVFAAKRIEGEWFDMTMSDVLTAMAMCRSIGVRVTGGEDAKGDRPILSGVAFGSDHAA